MGQVVPHHPGGHCSWWKQLELALLAQWGDFQAAEGVGHVRGRGRREPKAGDQAGCFLGGGPCHSDPGGQAFIPAVTRL